ncbi:hypothetical protein F8178_14780 [Haloechinothrix sp. LS1_15]|nr:hypothetical protein [Haloechinothrix sp. LS1_15]
MVTEATREHYAAQATDDLAGFQDGLRATYDEPGRSQHTLIGHSYGSTTIGHTARHEELDVDRMVFVGSPGVGVEHASDLGIDPGNVYATTAENDVIRGTPQSIHEQQPIADDFGAVTFASDPGDSGLLLGKSLGAHSQYWDPNNKALTNMGRIIAGQAPTGG